MEEFATMLNVRQNSRCESQQLFANDDSDNIVNKYLMEQFMRMLMIHKEQQQRNGTKRVDTIRQCCDELDDN